MNLLCIVIGLGAALVGYLVGGTRAHIANARHLDQLDRWIEQQAPGARPPLSRDDR